MGKSTSIHVFIPPDERRLVELYAARNTGANVSMAIRDMIRPALEKFVAGGIVSDLSPENLNARIVMLEQSIATLTKLVKARLSK